MNNHVFIFILRKNGTSSRELIQKEKKMFQLMIFCCLAASLALTAADVPSNDDQGKPGGSEKICSPLTGRVVLPADPKYDTSRLVSNYYSSKDSFPKAIVYCQNVHDVQNAVKWARCQNVSIRIRSGGHSHEGFSTGTDALLIDVSEMKGIKLDKVHNIATVQPGITGGELYSALFKEGMTQVGGTCADVGISGLVLSGGLGPLARIHGLACDNVLSLEMVDAKGDIILVGPDNEYKDLFWALRGGGAGNFGVVTSVELKIYPVKKVTWFNIGWDWNQPVDKVIAGWQEFFLKGDKRWFSHLDLWSKKFPLDKFKKLPIKAMGVFYGTPEDAKKELAPLLAIGNPSDTTIELVDWDKSIKMFEDATATYITEKPEYKSSGSFVMKPLPQEGVNTLVKALQNSPSPLLNVTFLGLGGAVKDKKPTETAFYYRDAEYFAIYSVQWLKDSEDKASIAEVDALRESLLPYTQGDYIGNPDRNLKDPLVAYYGGNVARLREIKAKYDPDNLFRYEQSISK